jgi:phage terminase large subunit
MKLKINPIYKGLFQKHRFKVIFGGRSSGKSYQAVEYLIIRSLSSSTRILCCREIQGSIRESVHKLICDTITRLKLGASFDITQYSIKCKNGSEFIFAGLYNNVDSIKSMEGIDICHVEESANVSKNSWEILLPTIRKKGSEFVIVFNPKNKSDATYQMFVVHPMPDSWILKVNYYENQYNSSEIINMANHCKETDVEAYDNIWLGNPLMHLHCAILADKLDILDFDLDSSDMIRHKTFYGLDWGYSNDPTAYLRCHVLDNNLYIDFSGGSTGMELNDIGSKVLEDLPALGSNPLYCDCAQPAMVSMLRADGISAKSAKKWIGSITDGIGVLRSFNKIIVHPRCANVIYEIENYSWKIDRNTNEILNVPEDKDNHWIDALRYALTQIIQNASRRTDENNGWESNNSAENNGWKW